jgi:hypothetical protein
LAFFAAAAWPAAAADAAFPWMIPLAAPPSSEPPMSAAVVPIAI